MVYAAVGGDVFKTTDGGGGWSDSSTGLPALSSITTVAVDPTDTDSLLAFNRSNGLYRSTDGGAGWSAYGSGLPNGDSVEEIRFDPADSTTLYAAYVLNRGVYKSTDSGVTWNPVNTGLTDADVNELALDPLSPGVVYAAGDRRGVFKSTDGAASWSLESTGIRGAVVLDIAPSPADRSVVYAGSEGGVYKSLDGGASWQPASTGLGDDLRIFRLVANQAAPGTLYAVGEDSIYTSTDGAATWTAIPAPPTEGFGALVNDPADPGLLFAAGETGVAVSSDGGAQWNPVNSGLSGGYFKLAIDPQDPLHLYAANIAGDVFVTFNGGGSWSLVDGGIPSNIASSLLVLRPGSPEIVYLSTVDRLLRTVDGGGLWTESTGFPSGIISALAVDPVRAGTVYMGRSTTFEQSPRVLRSTDEGEGWSDFGDGFDDSDSIRALAINPSDPGRIFAGSRRGVWVRELALFADGFETGDLAAWSVAVGTP